MSQESCNSTTPAPGIIKLLSDICPIDDQVREQMRVNIIPIKTPRPTDNLRSTRLTAGHTSLTLKPYCSGQINWDASKMLTQKNTRAGMPHADTKSFWGSLDNFSGVLNFFNRYCTGT